MALAAPYTEIFDKASLRGAMQNPMLMFGRQDCRIDGVASSREFMRRYHITDYTELDMDGGDIRRDLNEPVPEIYAQFNTVCNIGTLEHVWDAHTAWSNAIQAVRLGGYFLSISPYKGWSGHGMHLTEPLWIQRFMGLNGFEVLEQWDIHAIKNHGNVCHALIARRFEVCAIRKPQQIYTGGKRP